MSMVWTSELQQFITDHLLDDTARLLLSAHRYPSVDVPFAVEQIEARRRLRYKLPQWYANPDLIMGGRIPAEQCSSESTALYKQTLLEGCSCLCDMTGGMGVDFWYMSRGMRSAIYTECQHHLCEAARHNFDVLTRAERDTQAEGAEVTEILVREGLSTEMPVPDVDAIYLDPARRSDVGSRIYEIEDCLPNVIAWQTELLKHCKKLITKVSPMADISRTIQRLVHVADLHIVSVRNECKELLIVQQRDLPVGHKVCIHCVDFLSDKVLDAQFQLDDLSGSPLVASAADFHEARFLFEPDVSIMKAQAFAALTGRYTVRMLDANTHLFISSQPVDGFPGRSFVIDEVLDCSSRQLKQLKKRIPQANIATRNFPMSPQELRTRTGIRDGGEVYLFGCQVHDVGPVLLKCHKVTASHLC